MANSPFDILLDKTSILEIAANGTVVGTLATSDADAGDTFTYELLDNAGGRFSLVNGNQIAVADNSLLNYQSAIFHTIKVKTTDSTGLSYEKDINIGLIDAKRNLVGYWKLDETAGSFDNASFVNGNNDGTTQGSLNLGREGLLDEGVGFGGGRVNLGKNLLNYQPDNSNYQFTVAAWIKPTNLNDNQAIFAVDTADGGSDGFSFGLSGNQLYVYVPKISRDLKAAYTIGGTDVIIRATIPPDILVNQWFHVALTYNTDYTRTIYINGVKIASENWTQQKVSGLFDSVTVYTYLGASDSVRDYLIGAQDSNGGARFVGDIDEVRVYNKSLSQSDIVGVMEETNFAPKNLKLSNNAILATSITDGTFVGSFTVQDSILDAGKHTYSLVDDAGGLVGINNNRLVIKNASLLDYANNPNPTIKVRATDPANNITEQEFTLQLIPEERDNINQSLVAYYKLDEKSNDNYKLAVVNSSQYKKPNAGLFAQYFEDGDLTKNILTRIDPSINFFWNGFAPEPGLVSDFGALWRGQITAPTTGKYTFYFKGDEAALFINDQELLNTFGNTDINNEFVSQTINLQAGQAYDFEMEYYDGGGAGVAQLSWAGPGIEAQLVPANAFSVPPSLQNAGLFAEYFNDQNLTRSVLTRTDFGINFNWGGSPDPGVVNEDYFSVRWTGKVIAPVSGEYTFFVRGDNGVRLWVNGQQLVDAWQSQSFDNELTGKITLQEDQSYDFKLEYYDGRDTAAVQVAWEAPGITKQVIDGDYFSQQVNSYSNQASGYYTGSLNAVTKLTSAGPTRNQEGIYSSSAKFSQGNYIDLKINDSDLQYDKQFTVMGWIKPQNFKDWQYIFSASRKDTPGMALALAGKGFLLQSFIGTDPYVWQPFPDSTYANEWNHIAISYNDGNVTFYLNGTKIGTAYQYMNFAPDWQVFTDYTYLIGALTKENAGDTNGFKGNIDEFRFYNQTLTDTQITEIIKKYNSGPSDIKIASNVISTDTTDGSVIGKLDTVGIPLDKGQYTYELLDDAGGKFALSGDQIILKNKSLLSYLDKPIETIKIKSTNTRGQTTEKEITIQLIESEPENGLKAYYKLDESNNLTTKQVAIDSSGNRQNGFYNPGVVEDAQTNGAIRGEEGIDGTSASFNNWQDYINLGNQAITYNDQFTVSTWIRPSTLSGWQMILSADDNGGGAGFGFGLMEKTLAIIDWQSDKIFKVDLPAEITPDLWTHVAVSYAGQQATLFINGVSVGSQSFPITNSTRNYLIGAGRANVNDPNAYSGQIDEVRFYNVALSSETIKKLGNQPPSALELDNTSLVEFNARYPNTFETLVGTLSTTDVNAEAHTYELIDNPNNLFKIEGDKLLVSEANLIDYETAQAHDVVIRTTDTAGNSLDKKFTIQVIDTPDINKVAVFDGASDYYTDDVMVLPAKTFGGAVTVESWVYTEDANRSWQRILDFGSGVYGENNFVLSFNDVTGKIALQNIGSNGYQILSTEEVVSNNQWVHVAASVNENGDAAIYLNGELKASGNVGAVTNVERIKRDIGAVRYDNNGTTVLGYSLKGKLDDVRIWNTARSQEEIQYNMYRTLSGTEPGLSEYYSFDEKDADASLNAVVDGTGSGQLGGLYNGAKIQIDNLPPDPTDPGIAEELTTTEIPLLGNLSLDFVPEFVPQFEEILDSIFDDPTLNFSDGLSFAEYVKDLLPEGATIEEVPFLPGEVDRDEYKVSFTEVKTLASVPLSSNLGLPGFGIKTDGSANVDLVGKLDFTVGYNDIWGAYIDTGVGPLNANGNPINPYGATSVTINLSPRLSEDFSATGNLGFFQLDLKNDPNNPTGLNALYRLGLKDEDLVPPGQIPVDDGNHLTLQEYRLSKGRKEVLDSSFQFTPHIGLQAKTTFSGSAVLPSFNFNLGVNWEPTTYTGGQVTLGSLLPKNIEFNQVNLGLGTFVSDVIRPIVTEINTVITPFRPILKFATDDIPIFDQLGLKGLFDFNQDNKVTVLDLTNVFKVKILGQKPIDDRFFNVLNAINKVSLNLEQMASTPADQQLAINLGSFIFDDINTKTSNPFKNKKPTITATSESNDDALNKGTNSSYLSKAKNLFNSIKEVEGLGFPILTDPIQAMYLLTGQESADLITFDLPQLQFTFDVAREFSIWGPLYGRLGGGFSATANLGFGYDTYGLNKWKNNGFASDTALADTLDGFYVNAPPAPYNQLKLRAYVEAGFGLDVVVAAGYLIGGIEGKAGLRLVDVEDEEGESDDKLRPSEIAGRPFIDNFNINGAVNFYLDAYARLGVSASPLFEWRRNLLTAQLFEFSFGGGASGFTSNKYISGATVFLDANLNGIPDGAEPNTISGLDASYQLSYALETYDKNSNGVIDPLEGQLVSVGGTDIYTQLPVNIILTAPGRYEMITPVTTLVNTLEQNGFTSAEAEANVLFGLGLNPTINLATFNAQKEIEDGNDVGVTVMAAHVKLHNVMEQVTLAIAGVSTFSTAAISQVVTKNIADELVSQLYQGKTLDLTDATLVERLIKNSVDALIELEDLENKLRHAPTALDLSNKAIAESSASNAVVGLLSTTDPDQEDTHTYTLVNDAGGRFGVVDNQIVVANGSLLDFETTTSHTIRVKTTDAKGLSYEQDLVIQVTNTEEKAPTAIALSNAEVDENSANGTAIGNLITTDPNAGDTHTYTLIDDAGGRFAIVDNQVVVKEGSLLLYENATNHTIRVRSLDQTGLSYEQDLLINVKDVINAGLIAQYFGDQDLNNLLLTRKDATVNFDWGEGSPAGGIPSDHFSVRWSAQITVPTTGDYTFYATADDGVRLWVNEQNLVDVWQDQGATEYSGAIALTAGQSYNLRMEYYENEGGAVAQLAWSGPGIGKQIVPVDVFSSRADLTLGSVASNSVPETSFLAESNPVATALADSASDETTTSKWELIQNLSQQMATIIGGGSQKVEELLANTPIDQLLDKVSALQGVLISSTALDLQKLAKGEKSLDEVIAANNSEGLDQQVADLNDLSLIAVVGTEGDDNLTSVTEKPVVVGNTGNDTLNGLIGNDQLFGEDGDDTLMSNGGIDFLNGGNGDDSYVLTETSKGTTIADSSGMDTLSGISPVLQFMESGVMGLGRSGASLFIDLNKNGEIDFLNDITILNYFADAPTEGAGVGFIETVGTLAGADILELLKNHAPIVQQAIAPQQLNPYESYSLTLSRNIFQETDPNDYVVYSVTQADGTALPNWLTFDAGTMILTGEASAEDVGQYQLKVQGTDQGKLVAETPLSLSVQNAIYGGTPNKDTLTGTDGDDVLDGGLEADTLLGKKGNDSYYVNTPDDSVTEDPDEGTDIVYSLGDYRLPDNVENLTLTGTGILKGIGNAANNWITGGTGDNLLQGGLGQDTLEGGTGADKFYFTSLNEGRDLILDFDPTQGDRVQISTGGFGSNKIEDFSVSNGVLSFKGTEVAVLQKDGQPSTVTDLTQILDLPANNPPTIKQALTPLTVNEDAGQQSLSLDNLFEDADGNAIVKTVFANSNPGLVTATFVDNQLLLDFQGNQFGTAQITLRGSDNLDSVDSNFTVVVNSVNDLPVLNQKIADQTGQEGRTFEFQIPTDTFSDVEDSSLTYSLASDTKLPAGLAFDPVTGKFSGNLSDIVAGTYRITVIATDKDLAQISATFSLKIANTIEVDVTEKVSQFGASQSADTLGHLSYDLTDFGGEVTSKVDDQTLKQTDALFHNLVGLYQVENAEGAILDTLDLNGNGLTSDLLKVGDEGYARTALANAVNNFMLQLGAKGDAALNTDASEFGDVILQGGKMYAPFAIANGGKLIPVGGRMQDGISAFLAQNPNNTAANLSDFMTHAVAYFSFGSANPDGTEHLQNWGNNVFGFEDLPGNLGISDKDFNDAVFKFTFIA